MQSSKYNIISKVKDSGNYFIVNLLSQQADVISKEEAELLNSGKGGLRRDFIERGYVVDRKQEEKLFRKKYLEFVDARDTDEVQLFFVPTYACNFACSYCYQDEYGAQNKKPSYELLDSFYTYIDKRFSDRKKYITVFGGEPLLNSEDHKTYIKILLSKAAERKLDVAFVTNGYHLTEYIPILKDANIREVQVTLDGTANMHNSRRMLHGGKSTFEKIVEGIDSALASDLSVNLRMVIDKENILELPMLAQFAIDRGWTNSPLFKTQLGRNYELHHCQSESSRLFTRVEMYMEIYELLKEHPYIKEFHKPAFSIAKFMFEEGSLPDPLYDSCPGTKTEWAFDYTGKIYSCTATVGKAGEELGTFYPVISHNDDAIMEWEERDTLSIEKCHGCELQLACGGGCASVAKNQYGSVNDADCRPVRELLELGIGHYFAE
jgi:uncharacterized protein